MHKAIIRSRLWASLAVCLFAVCEVDAVSNDLGADVVLAVLGPSVVVEASADHDLSAFGEVLGCKFCLVLECHNIEKFSRVVAVCIFSGIYSKAEAGDRIACCCVSGFRIGCESSEKFYVVRVMLLSLVAAFDRCVQLLAYTVILLPRQFCRVL